jgi:hypothetical protein
MQKGYIRTHRGVKAFDMGEREEGGGKVDLGYSPRA